MLLTKLKPKSEFSRNVLTLMTGTTIAQAIPIVISPILTRIYTPEDFGVFALFVAISTIFGSIANARYELAIMLPKKDEDAINIFALGFIITSSLSLFLLILVIFFQDYFVSILNNKEIGTWLYFIPITVFFVGFFNILNFFNNRKKNYKDIAQSSIIKSIILAIVQISVGLLQKGASGLVEGQIISSMFANLRLFKNILKDKLLLSKIKKVKIIALAKKYQDFPKFSMWAFFANALSLNLINIFVSTFYNILTLGYFSLAQRVIGLPITLIATAIGRVFFQEANYEKLTKGSILISFYSTLKKLLLIGVPLFAVLFFIIQDMFALVFGENWRIAGVYAQILIPLYFFRFIISTFTFVPIIYKKIKFDLIFQVGLLVLYILIFLVGQYFKLDFTIILYIISILISIYYISYFLILFFMVHRFARLTV